MGKVELNRKYPLFLNMSIDLKASEIELSQKFFALNSPEDVADLLELSSYDFLQYILFILPQGKRYSKFYIPKRRGGQRKIQVPIENLKIVQQKLLRVLQVVYKPKLVVHGFVQERSIVSNAAKHIKRRYVFNIDLKDFFPSIHFGRVRGMFMAYPYNLNDKVATVLAQICSLPTGLPQGAPTSPIISNMICAKLDSQLRTLAQTHRCYYTRYADDLTFSTSVSKFPPAIAIKIANETGQQIRIGNELQHIIRTNGFKVNEQKTRLQTRNKRQEVTGLTTNEKVNVNRKYIRQIRAMLHAWEKYGYAAAEAEYPKYSHKKIANEFYQPPFQKVVKGKIEFLGMVRGKQDKIYIRFNNKAADLERASALSPQLFSFIEDRDEEILNLIALGETEEVEFKEGACLNPHTGKDNKKNMSQKILREVAALMNTKARGTLIIGIADDGKTSGIEREYEMADPSKANWDGYELFLTNLLNDSFSINNAYDFYRISRHIVHGKSVCCIRTQKANKPVLVKEGLYVRVGTQSRELKGADKVDFIMSWDKPS